MSKRGKSEVIEFNGHKDRRYSESSKFNERNYYCRNGKYLHREMWKFHVGAIPVGYHIHYIDKNPLNNDLSNLQCVSRLEHVRLHEHDFRPNMFTQEFRRRATLWHKSDSVREWHRNHAKQQGFGK